MPVSWRFALRPKWIIRHLLVTALVIAMVLLGLWQLRRLDDRRNHNALVSARQDMPVADVRAVVPAGAAAGDAPVEAVLYRKVRASGTFAGGDTVTVANRSLDGNAGGWVLTPLRFDDGSAVVVNRGFIRYDAEGELVAPPPPRGAVTVTGLVFPSQFRGSFGPTDPSQGRLSVLARADIKRYAAQLDYSVLPAYLQAETTSPAEPAPAPGRPALVSLDPPALDEGPHLSYAVQWFIFSTIALGGYGLLLRKVALEGVPEDVTEVSVSDR